jgi:hypothetical protein
MIDPITTTALVRQTCALIESPACSRPLSALDPLENS